MVAQASPKVGRLAKTEAPLALFTPLISLNDIIKWNKGAHTTSFTALAGAAARIAASLATLSPTTAKVRTFPFPMEVTGRVASSARIVHSRPTLLIPAWLEPAKNPSTLILIMPAARRVPLRRLGRPMIGTICGRIVAPIELAASI
jgi:hypothetical protein